SILAGYPVLQVIGTVILCAYVYKNIDAEVRDINTLGLGWVQAERVSSWSRELERSKGEIDISGYKFFYMDIETRDGKETFERVRPGKVPVTAVSPPHLRVTSHTGFLVFVGLVKAWAGFWEGAVVYTSLLALCWTY